ncbi:561_t:CDS:1, partial [Funneliformis geosporum]
MFKGFTENQKKIFEAKNQSASEFIFSLADLELVEINENRRKCRLLSNELSQKLHQIYSEGKSGYIPPIKFIDFESRSCGLADFPGNFHFIFSYDWWLLVNKKSVQENSEILSNGTLKFKFFVNPGCGLTVFSANYDYNFANQKFLEFTQARSSSLQEIQNTIQN